MRGESEHRRWTHSGSRSRGAAFQAGHGLYELLLDDEIEEEYGQGNDGCRGHDGVPALLGEGVVAGEGDGQCGQLVAADDEKGPEEGVPGPVEVDDNCGEQQRSGDWIGDLEEDVKVVGAVDDGGVDVLVGQRENGLAQEENSKRGDGAGQDDSGVGIEQPETVDLKEEGDHEELLGQYHQRQDGEEHHTLQGKFQFRQCVTHPGREEDVQQDIED